MTADQDWRTDHDQAAAAATDVDHHRWAARIISKSRAERHQRELEHQTDEQEKSA